VKPKIILDDKLEGVLPLLSLPGGGEGGEAVKEISV
jgi:hypothetical protein